MSVWNIPTKALGAVLKKMQLMLGKFVQQLDADIVHFVAHSYGGANFAALF